MSTVDEDEIEEHPSYGMVKFSRISGDPGRLFGSSLRHHDGFVSLSIGPGQRIHSLHSDHYHGAHRGNHIEVYLSSAQFAELLTTMNVGSGVPCTIRARDGKMIEKAPDVEVEVEKIRTGFKKDMRKFGEEVHTRKNKVAELLGKKTLSKEDRKVILDHMRMIAQHVDSNIPFALSQFEEATEKVVQHAKAEVDAFVSANVMAAGIKSLAVQISEAAPAPQLPGNTPLVSPPSAVVDREDE